MSEGTRVEVRAPLLESVLLFHGEEPGVALNLLGFSSKHLNLLSHPAVLTTTTTTTLK